MDLDHVLAKLQWPAVSEHIAGQLVAQVGRLIAPLAQIKDPREIPDLFEHVTVGYNSTMAAIEDSSRPLAGVLVCRSALGPVLSEPFATASAVHQFNLAQVPAHKDLDAARGVVGIRRSLGDAAIEQLLSEVGPVRADWAYQPATMSKRKKSQTPQKKPTPTS